MKKIKPLLCFSLFIFSFLFSCGLYAQNIGTFAGNGTAGFYGDSGPATAAELNRPVGLAFDNAGNLVFSDWMNNRIRFINTSGTITTIAGNGIGNFSGDGGPASAAEVYKPQGLCIDKAGNIYITDEFNMRVRMINTSGIITTIAGNGAANFSGDGGPATAAELNNPTDIAFDKSGNIYIGDVVNQRVRKISTSGIITTVAGIGIAGYSGDGGAATAAEISWPYSIKVDSGGNLYIGDYKGARIRKVDTSGIITTFAGNGIASYYGDGGPATAAEIYEPLGFAIDGSGNLYFSDAGNNVVRMINSSGTISTVAGNYSYGAGYSGDGGPAIMAELNYPLFICFDKWNNLYISDELNQRIRKVGNNAESVMELTIPGNNISVYPNPFTYSTTILVESEKYKVESYLELYDITGRKLKQVEFSGNEYTLSAEGLAKGMYFIRVLDKDKNVVGTSKIVVQ